MNNFALGLYSYGIAGVKKQDEVKIEKIVQVEIALKVLKHIPRLAPPSVS